MQPELTPEDIETASFTIGLRGYDKQEVEGFLADVADQLRAVTEASGSAYVDLGEEMGELLQHARNSADEMTRRAQEEATALRARVDAEISDKRREADEYVRRANEDIDGEVKRIREGAEEQARGIIEDAQQRIVILQKEEVEARERIRALRLQLLEVTLRMQRFESPEDSDESPDEEQVDAFEPTTSETLETKAAPTGGAFVAPVSLTDDEESQDIIDLEHRAEESRR